MYLWLRYSTEYVTKIRSYFGGDFDQAVILAIIVMHQIRRRQIEAHQSDSAPEPFGAPHQKPAWVNAKSVAEVTGIPRETVRRKLLIMQRHGWLQTDQRGRFALAVGPDRRAVVAVQFKEMVDWIAPHLTRFVCTYSDKMKKAGAPCCWDN